MSNTVTITKTEYGVSVPVTEHTVTIGAGINSGSGSSLSSTSYAGSDCTGSSGNTNRTLDCSTGTPNIVVVDREVLHPTHDYTLSGSVITFLNKVWDDQKITVWK